MTSPAVPRKKRTVGVLLVAWTSAVRQPASTNKKYRRAAKGIHALTSRRFPRVATGAAVVETRMLVVMIPAVTRMMVQLTMVQMMTRMTSRALMIATADLATARMAMNAIAKTTSMTSMYDMRNSYAIVIRTGGW